MQLMVELSACEIESEIRLLQECRDRKSYSRGKQLLSYMRYRQLDKHKILGNHLVSVLVVCGCLSDAHQVFDRLSSRNAHSWTSLIVGYADHNELPCSLMLYGQMQEDFVRPNSYTLVSLIKACTDCFNVKQGQSLHTDAVIRGLDGDLFVGSTIVDMYGTFGFLVDAQDVFGRLSVRDRVSWNALIAGYADHGIADKVLSLFLKMQEDGFCPNSVTIVCSLKACGILKGLETGQKLHNLATYLGVGKELFVGTALVDMYANCGCFSEACTVFNNLLVKDTILWAALVSGYAEHGHHEKVCICFQKMQQDCIMPDCVMFIHFLQACGIIGDLNIGMELNFEIVKFGLENDIFLANTLVDMYAKCGSLLESQAVFDQLCSQDEVSWNALIAGYAERGFNCQTECSPHYIMFRGTYSDYLQNVAHFYDKMQLDNVQPNNYTFVSLVKAFARLKDGKRGQELHNEIIKKGLEGDQFTINSLVDMYSKCGMGAEAHQVFNELLDQDMVSWNALLTGYVEYGLNEEALNCLEQMMDSMSPTNVTFVCGLKACSNALGLAKGQWLCAELVKRGFETELLVGSTMVDFYATCGLVMEAQYVLDNLQNRDEVTWTSLIAGYSGCGFGEEALSCIKHMQVDNISPSVLTFSCSLKVCANMGALETGYKMHTDLAKRGLDNNIVISNMLIDVYGKCGVVLEGKSIFDLMPLKDIVSWTAIIKSYGENHEGQLFAHCFEDMRQQGVKPNNITFTCLLAACSHLSVVSKGHEYFSIMKQDYAMEPTLVHYACMIDLLARNGQVPEAERYVEAMLCHPCKQDVLTPFLSGCKVYGELELGLRCFGMLLDMNQDDASAFMMLGDIYKSLDRLFEAHNIEKFRKHAGTQKKFGSAFIEVNSNVHGFVVGENYSESISEMLENVGYQVRHDAYVPDISICA